MTPTRAELIGTAVTAVLLVAGCTTVPERQGFDQVQTDVGQRSDHRLHWYTGTEEDEQAARAIRELLAQELTAEQSVQIALLNNRRLQATYEDLSVAQADLVQAGLLRNPVFDASLLFPISGGSTELQFGVAQSFLEIFVIPLRRKVAESGFAEARIRVTGAVLDLAYETRTAFYRAQAASQRVELFGQILLATELSHEFARRLRAAGNITELELARQRDLWEAAKVKLRRAEAALVNHREVLNRLMGLFGEAVHWRMRQRIVGETQLQYNAMQVGLFELLRAREQQIEAGEHYIQALANYWTARAALNQLLSSRIPPGFGSSQAAMSGTTSH